MYTCTQSCCPRRKSLSSRILEDQFISPCPYPRTISPCLCPCPRAFKSLSFSFSYWQSLQITASAWVGIFWLCSDVYLPFYNDTSRSCRYLPFAEYLYVIMNIFISPRSAALIRLQLTYYTKQMATRQYKHCGSCAFLYHLFLFILGLLNFRFNLIY